MAEKLFFNGYCLEYREVEDIPLPEVVQNTTAGNALDYLSVGEPNANPIVPPTGIDPTIKPVALETMIADPRASAEARAAVEAVLASTAPGVAATQTFVDEAQARAAGQPTPTDANADGRNDQTGQFEAGANHPAAVEKAPGSGRKGKAE